MVFWLLKTLAGFPPQCGRRKNADFLTALQLWPVLSLPGVGLPDSGMPALDCSHSLPSIGLQGETPSRLGSRFRLKREKQRTGRAGVSAAGPRVFPFTYLSAGILSPWFCVPGHALCVSDPKRRQTARFRDESTILWFQFFLKWHPNLHLSKGSPEVGMACFQLLRPR